MAVLASGALTLEISYQRWEHEWISYDIACCWRGIPIFADAALKRWNAYWDSRQPGAMLVNEPDGCAILPLLDWVIANRSADYVQLMEPDLTLAIYPDRYFPLLPSKLQLLKVSDAYQAQLAAEAAERQAAGGIRDDDFIQVIAAFDSYQLAGADFYSGDGPALHMLVTWRALKQFTEDLRGEYAAFAAANGIKQNDGD